MDLPGMIAALVPGAARPARDPYTPLAVDWAFHLLPPARPGLRLRVRCRTR